MKKACLLLITFLFAVVIAKAQDIITLTNGSQIQAKVMEINPDNIKYKDFNNQDGPTITVLKAGVTSIQYANGTKTVFNDTNTAPPPAGGSFTRSSNGGRYNSRNGDNERGYKRKPGRSNQVKGWYFGASLGEGITVASNADPSYSTSTGNYSGVNILATKMFTQHLGIQFGLGGENYSYGVSYGPNSVSYTNGYYGDNYSQSYLLIPVRALYFSNSKKRIGFYATAGFDFGILDASSDNEGDNLNSYYSSVIFSPYVSCGFEFRNASGRGIWMFGPFYKTTLSNFYSGNQYEGWMNSGNTGNLSSVGITINYMAKFGR